MLHPYQRTRVQAGAKNCVAGRPLSSCYGLLSDVVLAVYKLSVYLREALACWRAMVPRNGTPEYMIGERVLFSMQLEQLEFDYR